MAAAAFKNFSIIFKIFQYFSCSPHNTSQWIFRDIHRQVCFLTESLIKSSQKRAATGKDNTSFKDIGCEFRRCAFQRLTNSFNNYIYRFRQGFAYLN